MKPTPVPVATVCSACGLSWDDHGEKPTLEDCVRLLKAELLKRPGVINVAPVLPWQPPTDTTPYIQGQTWRSPRPPFTVTCATVAN